MIGDTRMNPTQARIKTHQWPDPYRSYATENIMDAERDLVRWPELRREINKDMTDAIKAWETVMLAATERID
jgi:hypothetical protein